MYKWLDEVVDAEQIEEHGEVDTISGSVSVWPGDWLLTNSRGRRWVLGDNVFTALYEPLMHYELPTSNKQ